MTYFTHFEQDRHFSIPPLLNLQMCQNLHLCIKTNISIYATADLWYLFLKCTSLQFSFQYRTYYSVALSSHNHDFFPNNYCREITPSLQVFHFFERQLAEVDLFP